VEGLIPTHPVNIPCGRKREYPTTTHDFRDGRGLTDYIHISVMSPQRENRTHALRGERRVLTIAPAKPSTHEVHNEMKKNLDG
jgi:hypothetical protein